MARFNGKSLLVVGVYLEQIVASSKIVGLIKEATTSIAGEDSIDSHTAVELKKSDHLGKGHFKGVADISRHDVVSSMEEEDEQFFLVEGTSFLQKSTPKDIPPTVMKLIREMGVIQFIGKLAALEAKAFEKACGKVAPKGKGIARVSAGVKSKKNKGTAAATAAKASGSTDSKTHAKLVKDWEAAKPGGNKTGREKIPIPEDTFVEERKKEKERVEKEEERAKRALESKLASGRLRIAGHTKEMKKLDRDLKDIEEDWYAEMKGVEFTEEQILKRIQRDGQRRAKKLKDDEKDRKDDEALKRWAENLNAYPNHVNPKEFAKFAKARAKFDEKMERKAAIAKKVDTSMDKLTRVFEKAKDEADKIKVGRRVLSSPKTNEITVADHIKSVMDSGKIGQYGISSYDATYLVEISELERKFIITASKKSSAEEQKELKRKLDMKWEDLRNHRYAMEEMKQKESEYLRQIAERFKNAKANPDELKKFDEEFKPLEYTSARDVVGGEYKHLKHREGKKI